MARRRKQDVFERILELEQQKSAPPAQRARAERIRDLLRSHAHGEVHGHSGISAGELIRVGAIVSVELHVPTSGRRVGVGEGRHARGIVQSVNWGQHSASVAISRGYTARSRGRSHDCVVYDLGFGQMRVIGYVPANVPSPRCVRKRDGTWTYSDSWQQFQRQPSTPTARWAAEQKRLALRLQLGTPALAPETRALLEARAVKLDHLMEIYASSAPRLPAQIRSFAEGQIYATPYGIAEVVETAGPEGLAANMRIDSLAVAATAAGYRVGDVIRVHLDDQTVPSPRTWVRRRDLERGGTR